MGGSHSAHRDVEYDKVDPNGTPSSREPLQSRKPEDVTNTMRKQEDVIVTKLRRDHWMVGAQILACIHDMIHFKGPYHFTNACIYGKALEDKVGPLLEGKDAAAFWVIVMRHCLTFLFCIVMPFCAPVVVAKFMVHFKWGYEKHGDTFTLGNLVLNVTKIAEALQQANQTGRSNVEITNVAMLRGQRFQKAMSDDMLQLMMGFATLVLLAIFLMLHGLSKHSKLLKRIFVFKILHFLWISNDYPQLQYTSGEIKIFCGMGPTFKLFSLVPCAWLATVSSFVIVLPAYSVYLEHGDLSILKTVLPNACLAAFAFGKIYMQLADATFAFWLSTSQDYALVVRQFTLNPMYKALQMHQEMFTVTVDELESLANNSLMHDALLNDAGISADLQEAVRRESAIGSNQDDDAFKSAAKNPEAWWKLQEKVLNHCMDTWVLRVVFVKDISAAAGSDYWRLELKG